MSGSKHKKIKLEDTTITTEQNQLHGSQEISRTTSSTLHVHKMENKTISNSSKMVATTSKITHNVKGSLLSSLSEGKRESLISEKLCNQDYLSQFKPIGVHFTANINDETTTQTDQMSLPSLIESAPQEQVLQLLQGDHSFSQYELDNALMAACRRGHKFFLQKLLRLGANVQYKDTNGNTPLMVCAENGLIEIVRFLLKRKADANAVNDAGDTALILSIRTSGSTDMVKVLLEQPKIDIHHQNHNGYTAFMKAVEAMDIDTIEILWQKLNNQKNSIWSNDKLFLESNSSKLIFDNVDEKSRTLSEKLGIKNVLDLVNNHERHESRLTQAFELLDEESFNILVDSNLSTSNYANCLFSDVLKNIFYKKNLKHIDVKEISMIKSLLECGTSLKDNSLRDYVTAAVEAGNYLLVELLCQHMPQESWYRMYLSRYILTKLLPSYGADVNQHSFSLSPLDRALKQGHINWAKLLIELGAKLDIKEALFSAVHQKTAHYMNFLQQNYKHEILNYLKENKPSLQGLLISAVRGGNMEIIGQILDDGADINQPMNTGETALEESKNGEVAKFLIQRGADVNQMVKDSEGWLNSANINDIATPQTDQMSQLVLIESAPQEQVLQLLQGDHSFSQYELDNALMAACRRGHKFFLQKLLRLGANVQYKDTIGNTPLMVCAENGLIEIVRFLLKKKADANAVNDAGDTALILSIRTSGSTDMVKVLLEQPKIDIHHQNHNGYTAFMKAVEAMDIVTIEILWQKLNNQKNSIWSNDKLFLESNSSKLIFDNVDEKSRTLSEKLGIKNVLDLVNNHERHESRLTQAFELLDEESFNILVDSNLSTSNYADCLFSDVLKNIFYKKNLKHIDVEEISMIKSLLECGTSLKDNSLRDYVTAAVEAGNYPLVELLCQHMPQESWYRVDGVAEKKINFGFRFSIDGDVPFFQSLLDRALKNGHINCAKPVIEHSGQLDIQTALFSAVDQETAEYMNFLKQNYNHEIVNYLKEDKENLQGLLISATRGGNIEIIGQILDDGADINQPIDTGETALVESKNGEVAKFLIQRGADVNQMADDSKGWLNSPLVYVLKSRHGYDSEVVEIVRVLLQNGALVNGKDKHERTSLMLAACKEESETLLKILLDHGADLCDKDKDGNTALILAALRGFSKNVLFLLYFANKELINDQNNKGLTALMCSVIGESKKLMTELLFEGADVNIQDTKGNTVLHIVIETGQSADILRSLITAGSDVNCQNNHGYSPLMLASKKVRNDCVLVLLDSGADVNALNKKDPRKTALSYCMNTSHFMHHFTVVECLVSLLDRGACASYADPLALARIIKYGCTHVIPKMIQCGLGPADVSPTKSPLLLSLLTNNVALARYFFGNMFLTKTDVPSLMDEEYLRDYLKSMEYQECLDFLNEFTSQPLSLFKLAFVSVSSAVGTSPGRENRINTLPLPQMIKDKLLFKSEEVIMVYEPSMQSPVYDSSDDLDSITGSSDESDSYYGLFSSDEDNYDTN